MHERTIRPNLESLEMRLAPTGAPLVLSSATLVYTPVATLAASVSTVLPPTTVPKDPNQLLDISNQLQPPQELSIPRIADPLAPATSTPSAVPPTYFGTLTMLAVSATTTGTGAASVVAPVVAQQGLNVSLLHSPLMEGVSW